VTKLQIGQKDWQFYVKIGYNGILLLRVQVTEYHYSTYNQIYIHVAELHPLKDTHKLKVFEAYEF